MIILLLYSAARNIILLACDDTERVAKRAIITARRTGICRLLDDVRCGTARGSWPPSQSHPPAHAHTHAHKHTRTHARTHQVRGSITADFDLRFQNFVLDIRNLLIE